MYVLHESETVTEGTGDKGAIILYFESNGTSNIFSSGLKRGTDLYE